MAFRDTALGLAIRAIVDPTNLGEELSARQTIRNSAYADLSTMLDTLGDIKDPDQADRWIKLINKQWAELNAPYIKNLPEDQKPFAKNLISPAKAGFLKEQLADNFTAQMAMADVVVSAYQDAFDNELNPLETINNLNNNFMTAGGGILASKRPEMRLELLGIANQAVMSEMDRYKSSQNYQRTLMSSMSGLVNTLINNVPDIGKMRRDNELLVPNLAWQHALARLGVPPNQQTSIDDIDPQRISAEVRRYMVANRIQAVQVGDHVEFKQASPDSPYEAPTNMMIEAYKLHRYNQSEAAVRERLDEILARAIEDAFGATEYGISAVEGMKELITPDGTTIDGRNVSETMKESIGSFGDLMRSSLEQVRTEALADPEQFVSTSEQQTLQKTIIAMAKSGAFDEVKNRDWNGSSQEEIWQAFQDGDFDEILYEREISPGVTMGSILMNPETGEFNQTAAMALANFRKEDFNNPEMISALAQVGNMTVDQWKTAAEAGDISMGPGQMMEGISGTPAGLPMTPDEKTTVDAVLQKSGKEISWNSDPNEFQAQVQNVVEAISQADEASRDEITQPIVDEARARISRLQENSYNSIKFQNAALESGRFEEIGRQKKLEAATARSLQESVAKGEKGVTEAGAEIRRLSEQKTRLSIGPIPLEVGYPANRGASRKDLSKMGLSDAVINQALGTRPDVGFPAYPVWDPIPDVLINQLPGGR